jgi:hypothetical protein
MIIAPGIEVVAYFALQDAPRSGRLIGRSFP